MVKFVGLRNPVMILVDPKKELQVHTVGWIDYAIAVSPLLWSIKHGQSEITIGRISGFRLRGEIAEQILAAGDSVASVESEESIVRSTGGPGELLRPAISPDVKAHPVCSRRELETLAGCVDNDRALPTTPLRVQFGKA